MVRPKLKRRVKFNPSVTYFKPQGVPLRILEETELSAEELEALRLKFVKNLDQEKAAKQMNTSQSTFQRILTHANRKIADALVNGKALKIIQK